MSLMKTTLGCSQGGALRPRRAPPALPASRSLSAGHRLYLQLLVDLIGDAAAAAEAEKTNSSPAAGGAARPLPILECGAD